MATFLFSDTIFGPVKSRRFGVSLGVNLLPTTAKFCSFDCVYCECGLNEDNPANKAKLPTANQVATSLEFKLKEMASNGELPDVITFAGNGEPTMHPEFETIMRQTVELRTKHAPNCEIVVLSNAMHIDRPNVHKGLLLADKAVLKLDTVIHKTFLTLNRPNRKISIVELIRHLRAFSGKMVLQTLFCSGIVNGEHFDNTTSEEVDAWLTVVRSIKPEGVMIYTYSRDTPIKNIQKAPNSVLLNIAEKLKASNIKTEVTLNNEE